MRRASIQEYLRIKALWVIFTSLIIIGLVYLAITGNNNTLLVVSGIVLAVNYLDTRTTFICAKCYHEVKKRTNACPNCGNKLRGDKQ